jgi:hypothetical protein
MFDTFDWSTGITVKGYFVSEVNSIGSAFQETAFTTKQE